MRFIYFLFFILLFSFQSTYSQTEEESDSQKWTLTPKIINIDYRNKIFVKINKAHSDSITTGNQYSLNLISQFEFECKNYEIVSSIDTSGKRIIVTLYGIKSPVVCLKATGPATSSHILNLKNGSYSLILRYDGIVDTYKLRVRNGRINFEEDSVEFTRKWKSSN